MPVAHFVSSVKYAVSQQSPCHFFYVQNVFPWDFYWKLLERLPVDEAYPDDRFGGRRIAVAEKLGPFWSELASSLQDGELLKAVMGKFRATLQERFPGKIEIREDVRLVRDTSQYKIAPHTDLAEKAVSLLVYLPRDKSLWKYGTSLYAPKDAGFKCVTGKPRYAFEKFSKVFTAPFMPNSVFGFARTDQSFHGVEPIGDVVRDVLLYNVYMRNV